MGGTDRTSSDIDFDERISLKLSKTDFDELKLDDMDDGSNDHKLEASLRGMFRAMSARFNGGTD